MFKRLSVTLLICASAFTNTANAEEAMDPQRLFEDAMQLREHGFLFDSIEVFETILSKQPELGRARLELAVSYHQARRYAEAKEQLQKVLENPETPAAVKLSVTAYLAQLGSDAKVAAKRTTSTVYLSAGMFKDSNANLGPTEIQNPESTSIGNVEALGSVVMMSYSHRSRSSQPLSFGKKRVDMEWHTQMTSYNKVHTKRETAYNLNLLSLSTGPVLIADKRWRAALNVKIDKIFFGGNPYADYVGINPLFTLIMDKQLEVNLESQLTARDFSTTSGRGLRGVEKMYGMSVSKLYPNKNIGVEAGMRYHSNGAIDPLLGTKGISIFLGGQMGLWKNNRGYVRLGTRNYKYQGIDTGRNFSVKRDDTETQLVIGTSQSFKEGALKSWTINAQYTYTSNATNTGDAELAKIDYKRNILAVNLRRYF